MKIKAIRTTDFFVREITREEREIYEAGTVSSTHALVETTDNLVVAWLPDDEMTTIFAEVRNYFKDATECGDALEISLTV